MTEIIIGGAQSYTLPLESIDLTYLRKYAWNPRDGKIPIWSKRRLDGESEYYQLQIIAQDINEDNYYLESIDTYKCHICNINVPKICYKEHNENKKHETYKKIFENVFERLSKQMNISIINNDREIPRDVYYCVPCSKLITIENKYKHEASNYHTNSLEEFKILNDFYEIFSLKDNKDKQEQNLTKETELRQHPDSELGFNKQNNTTDSNNNNPSLALESDNNFDSVLDNNTQNTNSSLGSDENGKKTTFKTYLKEMKEKYKLQVTLPQTDGDNIYIVNTNGEKLKTSHENFHSYRDLRNSTYCQMCNMWISQKTTAHDVSEKHVRNVFKLINDKFARMMDSVSSHCIICNEVVLTESDHHKLNDDHKKLYDMKITQEFQCYSTAKTGKTLCNICNVYIDSHNFVGHTNSNKHKLKENRRQINLEKDKIVKIRTNIYTCRFCNISIIEQHLNSHINSNAHIAKKKFSGEYCEICKINVPKGGMKTHMKGTPHGQDLINKVKTLPTEITNQIISSKENNDLNAASSSTQTVNTSVKNTTSTESNFGTSTNSCHNMSNNNTTKNKDKMFAYNELIRYIDDKKKKVKCSICNVKVSYSERNVIEHMEGRSHLEALAKTNKAKDNSKSVKNENIDSTGIHFRSNNPINVYKLLRFTDPTKTEVECNICLIILKNNEPTITDHMNSRCHLEKVGKKNMTSCYRLKILSNTNDAKDTMCNICDIKITCDLNGDCHEIIRHIEGNNHINEVYRLLNFHKIRKRPRTSNYYCECCDLVIIVYLDHITSKTHIENFQTKYVIDKSIMKRYVNESNEQNGYSLIYKNLYKNLLLVNRIQDFSNNTFYCVVCCKYLGGKLIENEIDHIFGKNHKLCLKENTQISTLPASN